MHVVWHNDGHMLIILRTVIVTATSEDDVACPIGQYRAPLGYKSDEVGFEITLQVR